MKMMKVKPKRILLGPELSSFTPDGWIEYVKSLYNQAVSKGSKAVEGVSIYFGERVILRVSRKPKFCTREEIGKLAEEYSKTEAELLTLFRSRKIEIRYEQSDERAITEAIPEPPVKRTRKKRTTKCTTTDNETNSKTKTTDHTTETHAG